MKINSIIFFTCAFVFISMSIDGFDCLPIFALPALGAAPGALGAAVAGLGAAVAGIGVALQEAVNGIVGGIQQMGSRNDWVPNRGVGGSGKPRRHYKKYPSRKAAEDAAREAGKGNPPVHHTPHEPGQDPHFHPTDKDGNIIKDGSHYEYPK